jgi:feruloyl-CoA synthase
MDISMATPSVGVERRADGTMLLWSTDPLREHAASPLHWLMQWAQRTPDRVLLAERAGGNPTQPWRTLTYDEAVHRVGALSQSLVALGLSRDHDVTAPIMCLSGNSIDQAVLMLASFAVGVPFAPVSTAYSLVSSDHGRLKELLALVPPCAVFVDDTDTFASALAHLPRDIARIATTGSRDAHRIDELVAHASRGDGDAPGDEPNELARLVDRIDRHDIAKILFTSGSTGVPKAVIQTHGMMTANQQSLAQCWTFIEATPPVLVDWLPWSHVFGSNNNFHLVLRNGGTHYIDHGKPTPNLISTTVANLRDVAPTIMFNVPAGYAALLPHLESDEGFAAHVFSRLQMIFYAGSALPQDLWDRLHSLSARYALHPIPIVTSWGATETAPSCTAVHTLDTQRAAIGIPIPGVTVKLVPSGDRYELRVKGPNITPGYVERPDLTAAAFDDEGFYCMGDAGRLVDPDRLERGLLFDGRVAEDFKLSTGTWVHVGGLRTELLGALAPYVSDALIAGHDRADVRALVWPSAAAQQRIAEVGCEQFASDLASRLHDHGVGRASSRRVTRVLLLDDQPSIDAGELTDKNYINQRVALANRSHLVDNLYSTNEPVVITAA